MTTRGEIAKLFLYAEGKGAVTIADIEAIVSDAAPSALDDAVDHAFLGDLQGSKRPPIAISPMAAIPARSSG